MTDPQLTLIAVLLDRSGSMETVKSDIEGAFMAFIADQADAPGEARVTLAQFDTEFEVVFANRPIGKVGPLELQPRGMTALYDSMGRLITDVGAELRATPEAERPGKVIIVVMTDGHENSSQEWTHQAVGTAIKRQERDYAWDFVFLGANMDAVQIGTSLGFAPDKSMTWDADGEGVANAMASTSAYVRRSRLAAPGVAAAGFSPEDRRAASSRTTQ